MTRSKIRTTASAVSGPASSVADCLTFVEHLRLALRLIDRQRRLVLQPADFHGARDAHVQQPHELVVDHVDPAPQLLDAQDFSQRTYSSTRRIEIVRRASLGDDVDERAADDGGVGPLADFAHVLGLGDAEPERHRQVADAPDALAPSPRAPSASSSRAPVTPRREIAYRKPLPRAAAFRRRSSVVVGLSRRIVSIPRVASMVPEVAGLLDRQVEHQHAVDAGLAARDRQTARHRGAESGWRS